MTQTFLKSSTKGMTLTKGRFDADGKTGIDVSIFDGRVGLDSVIARRRPLLAWLK